MTTLGDITVTFDLTDVDQLLLSYLQNTRHINVDTIRWVPTAHNSMKVECFLSPEGRIPRPSLGERIKARIARKDKP